MSVELNEDWTVEVVARMHKFKIRATELADRCDYTAPYISMVLNGKKKFESELSKEHTKQHIFAALEELEHEIQLG